MISELLHILLALIITIPLIVGFIYLLKRYTNYSYKNTDGIKLVKQLALGNKERILVVEVEEIKLIIGISSNTFNTLHVINKNAK